MDNIMQVDLKIFQSYDNRTHDFIDISNQSRKDRKNRTHKDFRKFLYTPEIGLRANQLY